RHTRCYRDWSSDVCSSDLIEADPLPVAGRYAINDAKLRQSGGTVADDPMPAGAAERREAGEFRAVRVEDRRAAGLQKITEQALRSEERRVGKESRPRGWPG